MKMFLTFTALIFAFSNNALSMPVVESVKTTTMLVPSCDFCDGGVEVTQTTLIFTDSWCSSSITSDAYEVLITEEYAGFDQVKKYVEVRLKSNQPIADCMGPTTDHRFTITTDKFQTKSGIILKNPSTL